jgi:hypothetical protein
MHGINWFPQPTLVIICPDKEGRTAIFQPEALIVGILVTVKLYLLRATLTI